MTAGRSLDAAAEEATGALQRQLAEAAKVGKMSSLSLFKKSDSGAVILTPPPPRPLAARRRFGGRAPERRARVCGTPTQRRGQRRGN
jgi:hypothetical protein